MDISTLLDKIKTGLLSNGLETESQEWDSCIRSSSAGSELLGKCAALLLWYKEYSPQVYTVLKIETEELVKYCHSIGLYPKAFKD